MKKLVKSGKNLRKVGLYGVEGGDNRGCQFTINNECSGSAAETTTTTTTTTTKKK